MAKNAEKTLPQLLKSIRPYVTQIVCGVDELDAGKTARAAKAFGADEVFPLHVTDWHECVHHGRVPAQHFSNARQETFKHLDPSLDFWGWLDADDVLEGGDRLKAFLDGLAPEIIGSWHPYHYAAIMRADGKHQVNTLFHRERFLRTHFNGKPVVWTWKGRVHETVQADQQAGWAINDDIVVVHQQGIHQTGDSAPRNQLLLEIDYEEEIAASGGPTDRTLFYLGNQHFALGNWREAIGWYEMLCGGAGGEKHNPYELWQAYIYASYAYERTGDLENATRAALYALDTIPSHGDPYFRMGALASISGDFEKALYWNNLGRKTTDAPFFAFKNPLDRSFNQRRVQADAYMNLGRIDAAEIELTEAAKVFVDAPLAEALNEVHKTQQDIRMADGFVALASGLPLPGLKVLFDNLPIDVKAFGRTRDLVMPGLMGDRGLDGRRIVFWCGQSLEPWGPPSLNTTGIGGSETAVIEIAKRFAADGWLVDVFNEAERYEGVYDGVGYWDLRRYDPETACDVFVSWRRPDTWALAQNALQKVLWCHDLNYGPDAAEHFQHWDRVLGVSDWHRGMLARYYPEITAHYDFVPNGIDLSRFDKSIPKVPFRCVYASSPDRGLAELLALWPQIVKAEPTAELHIAYGWDNIDKMIQHGRRDLAGFRDDMTKKIAETPRVVWRGRLPQDELARLYCESVVWAYSCEFLEVSCISGMEAMAGGAIPVTTRIGALPETIGEAGFLIPGPTRTRAYADMFPKAVLGAAGERNVREAYGEQARRRASGMTWDAAYVKWKGVLGLEQVVQGSTESPPESRRNGKRHDRAQETRPAATAKEAQAETTMTHSEGTGMFFPGDQEYDFALAMRERALEAI